MRHHKKGLFDEQLTFLFQKFGKKAVVDSRRERVFHKIACLSDFDETEKFRISDYFFGLSITTETLERDKSIKFSTSWRSLYVKFNLFYISCR